MTGADHTRAAGGQSAARLPSNDTESVDELRRRLVEAEERSLNAVDAVIGAEAAAAQARLDIDDIFHRLHVREQELKALKELLGHQLDTPLDEIAASLGPDLDRRRRFDR